VSFAKLFWNQVSGTELIILEERSVIGYLLPINDIYLPLIDHDIKITLISGSIPNGLRLEGAYLNGTTYEVPDDIRSTFVLRAEQYGVVVDRTFSIVVTGPDAPTWVTAPNLLPIGSNNTYYVLDSELVDFQLEATDTDLVTGQQLEFFIDEGDGILPPGITLTSDGRLVGVVEPILAIEKVRGSGAYDDENYSRFPYDFGIRPDNGFDSFFYDAAVYDIFSPSRSPKKLNRYYDFIVSVSDGFKVAKRRFKIYLVGDDYFRSDNTIMKISNGVFTADNTFIRTPIWLTPSNLGYRRANNYVTIFLDVIDPASLVGEINYELLSTNDDGSPSIIPRGMSLDPLSGEITGKVPYQPAVTTTYKFTVRANRLVANVTEVTYKDKTFTLQLLGEIESFITWNTDSNLGLISSNYTSTLNISATTSVPNANLVYTFVGGKLPPGLRLSFDGELIGKVNSYGTATAPGLTVFDNGNLKFDSNTTFVDRSFTFTARVQDHFGFSAITRDFTIHVSDPKNVFYSNLYVRSFMSDEKRLVYQTLITNTNIFEDEYIYRPNDINFGVQKNLQMLVFAGIESKSAGYFVAAMAKNHKRKKFILGELKVAVAKNEGTNDIVYELIYIDVIDPAENDKGQTRNQFTIFTTNKNLINQTSYELLPDSQENTDPFGIVFETRFLGASSNHYFYPDFRVLLRNGTTVPVGTRPLNIGVRNGLDANILDNLIIGMPDPYRFRPNPTNSVKVDSNVLTTDGELDNRKYISNITHMRKNIRKIGETELSFLPLWMRTSQPGQIKTLGYVKAVPLCYCKPGKSNEILTRLKLDGIKFNQFNFDINRYIIDSIEGNSNEQYLLFSNYTYNV